MSTINFTRRETLITSTRFILIDFVGSMYVRMSSANSIIPDMNEYIVPHVSQVKLEQNAQNEL